MLSLVAQLEPGPGAKRGGIRTGIERPHSILDDRYGKSKADADDDVQPANITGTVYAYVFYRSSDN